MADKTHELESLSHDAVKPQGRVSLRGAAYAAPFWWSVLPTIQTGALVWQLPLEHRAICDHPSARAGRRIAWGWLHPTAFLIARSTRTVDDPTRPEDFAPMHREVRSDAETIDARGGRR